MRNYFNEYQDLDRSVFGISTDSPLVLAVWRKDLRLPFALLMSDYNRGVCRDYQCLYTSSEDSKAFASGMVTISRFGE